MPLFMRNLETGEIKTVEPDSKEFAACKAARADNGLPLWEQTSAGDADPKTHASSYEVEHRELHDAPVHDVTTDGAAQSAKTAKKFGQNTPLGETVAEKPAK